MAFPNQLNDYIHSSQSHPVTRHWQSQSAINFSAKDFVLPLFVVMDDDAMEMIDSFPDVHRMGINMLLKYLKPLVENDGLSSVLVFPCLKPSEDKSLNDAFDVAKNPLIKAIPIIRQAFPGLLIITDVCLCTFSNHGHCCVFDDHTGRMDNAGSVEMLTKLSLQYATLGVDVLAPSDMMDSRIASIRECLNKNGYSHVSILTYGAKFESGFYGPFRNAANSAPKFGDRKQYQLPAGSKGLAARCVDRDIRQGADLIMVKPAMVYLDIVRSIADKYPNFPICVYQVSGEYSMIKLASKNGIFDLKRIVFETITSFKRAGASIIITYFTPDLLKWIKE